MSVVMTAIPTLAYSLVQVTHKNVVSACITTPIMGGILRRVTQNHSSIIGKILRNAKSKEERFCANFSPFEGDICVWHTKSSHLRMRGFSLHKPT